MPTFQNIEVTAQIDVEFEVFCSCGNHMCQETDTRSSRNRSTAQAVVNTCPKCLDAATWPLQERIEELEQLLAEARANFSTE